MRHSVSKRVINWIYNIEKPNTKNDSAFFYILVVNQISAQKRPNEFGGMIVRKNHTVGSHSASNNKVKKPKKAKKA